MSDPAIVVIAEALDVHRQVGRIVSELLVLRQFDVAHGIRIAFALRRRLFDRSRQVLQIGKRRAKSAALLVKSNVDALLPRFCDTHRP